MKRVLTFLAIMLLPLSVMAMTPVTDSDLADVTGQAGVNINADLQMDIAIGTMAWGDSDGVGALAVAIPSWGDSDAGGYVGVTGFNITNLRIKARETDDGFGLVPYTTANLKPITIDVCSDSSGVKYDGRTFVRFGLGSLEITMDAMAFNVALGATPTAMTEVMGSVNLGAMAIYINPISYVDIYSHAGQGVNLTFNVMVDEFALNYISWGDADGLVGGNVAIVPWMVDAGPGYVGLQNLHVGVISITGTVAIDVTSTAAGVYAAHGPVTVVHIAFSDSFNFTVYGPITANVNLCDNADLATGNVGTLGDIYISGLSVSIYDGSWVDIWAH